MKKKLKIKLSGLDKASLNKIIKWAWHDYTSFESIKKEFNLSEEEVIEVMRKELKPSSFRLWRKRMNSNLTKHEKLSSHRREFEKKLIDEVSTENSSYPN